ncbi:MAG: bifunctional diguanylate cyclase/phosphodiesterase, partial [Solobacterium sp.]|nr:bifunctional diguanylate cyclase/phosphodiesterase [Solobacterium sp.]
SWKARRILTRDREKKYFALEKQTVRDENGKVAGSFLSVRDETENMLALEKEQYNARHDNLTGLYTREYLYERMHDEMSRHPEISWLVLYLDVNDFKMINDIFGPSYGDFALISIAGMLQEELPETTIYGRLSGDQFGICVPASDFDQDHLEDVLEDFAVNDGTVGHHILIHGGIYEVNEPGLDIGIMFDRARMAMANIKGSYQIHLTRFDEKMRDEALWTQHLSGQINEAIEKRQIIPYLQAMVNSEGTVVGAEALVRWNHPKYGFLSPARFIPIFEKNGMIAEVDKYMWKCACEILASWKKTHPDLFLSVNISPKDFYFTDVEEEIRTAAKEYDVDPSHLRLEITETVMMTDITNRVKILNSLKESGFLVEMDDFGSGYSSLNLLKDMPVDVIKIDMMFLNKSDNETKAKMILKNIIRLSENLGIEPLTEGVETRDQFTMLNQMGCRLFQGFYFAKPMPLESFEQMLDHPDISKLN